MINCIEVKIQFLEEVIAFIDAFFFFREKMKEPRLEMLSDLFKITHVFVAKIGIEGSPCNLPLPKTCIYPSIKERRVSVERNCL